MKEIICFKEVLVLLWFAACAKALCLNETVCVASEKEREAECQRHHSIHRLSDLAINASCEAVKIYLTGGTHILNKNLDFTDSVERTEIYGAPHGPPTVIDCNDSGIRFSENENANTIFVSNILLLHCHRIRNLEPGNSTIQAAQECSVHTEQCGG